MRDVEFTTQDLVAFVATILFTGTVIYWSHVAAALSWMEG